MLTTGVVERGLLRRLAKNNYLAYEADDEPPNYVKSLVKRLPSIVNEVHHL